MENLSSSSSGRRSVHLRGAVRVAACLLWLTLIVERQVVARQSYVVAVEAIGGPRSEALQDLFCASSTGRILGGEFAGSVAIAGLEATPNDQAAAGLFVSKVVGGMGSWIILFEPLEARPGESSLYLAGIAGDSDGNVYLAGGTDAGVRTGPMSVDGNGQFLSAISRDGIPMWTKMASDSAFVVPGDVTVLASYGVATLGMFSGRWLFAGTEYVGQSNGHGGADLYVATYSPTGVELDLRTVDTEGGGFPHELIALRSGDLLATGETVAAVRFGNLDIPGNDSAQQGRAFNYFVGRLSAELEPLWGLRLGDQITGLSHVAERSDGKIYWAGSFRGEVFINGALVFTASENATQSVLVLLGSDGELEWIKAMADDAIDLSGLSVGSADEAIISTVLARDFTLGETTVPVSRRTHALVVFTDSGEFAELVEIGSPARPDFLQDMLPCHLATFPVTIGSYNEPRFVAEGHVLTNAGETDSYIAEVAFNTAVLLSPQAQALPGLQVYPNPSLGRLLAVLPSAHASPVRLELFDLIGRRLRHRSVGQVRPAGKIALDVSGLPAGVYMLRVSIRDGRAESAVVILR